MRNTSRPSRIRSLVLHTPALVAGRLVRFALRRLLSRGGSAVPGRIANAMAPKLLTRTLNSFQGGLVVVTGSSGKSTTAKMLTAILRAHGTTVFTNSSTANLRQGITSAIIDQSDLFGRIAAEVAVIELDEAVAARLARELAPHVVVLTNVMPDQVDRFHSPQRVAGFLGAIAARATGAVVANRDDGHIVALSDSLSVPVRWFGAAPSVPQSQLGYSRPASHPPGGRATILTGIGDRSATLDRDRSRIRIALPSRGVHYGLDAAAAVEAAATVLGRRFHPGSVVRAFAGLQPVFGRGEVVRIGGEDVELVLVQNPASFQLNLDVLQPRPEQLLIAVGSDVRDASWLWTVRTEGLEHVDIVTGSKAHEIALRLAYDDVEVGGVVPSLEDAVPAFLSLPRPTHGIKTIVFTADPMRRIRRQLGLDQLVDAA